MGIKWQSLLSSPENIIFWEISKETTMYKIKLFAFHNLFPLDSWLMEVFFLSLFQCFFRKAVISSYNRLGMGKMRAGHANQAIIYQDSF